MNAFRFAAGRRSTLVESTLAAASQLAERADGCTGDMEVGDACSVRQMPQNPDFPCR